MVNREIKARKRAVKEEKEEIDGEIVRIRKGHPRTNLPVKLPENPTWLKQPNVVTLMAGDFKTVQIRILIAVIEKLTQYFKSNTIDSVVINAVVEASLKMDGSKFETRHPSLGLVPDVKLFLTNGGVIRSNAKIIMRWHISMLDCHITL